MARIIGESAGFVPHEAIIDLDGFTVRDDGHGIEALTVHNLWTNHESVAEIHWMKWSRVVP